MDVVVLVVLALLVGAVGLLVFWQLALAKTLRVQIRAHDRHMDLHRLPHTVSNGHAPIEDGEQLVTEAQRGDH